MSARDNYFTRHLPFPQTTYFSSLPKDEPSNSSTRIDSPSVDIEASLAGSETTLLNIKNSTRLFSLFPVVVLLVEIGRLGPKPAT